MLIFQLAQYPPFGLRVFHCKCGKSNGNTDNEVRGIGICGWNCDLRKTGIEAMNLCLYSNCFVSRRLGTIVQLGLGINSMSLNNSFSLYCFFFLLLQYYWKCNSLHLYKPHNLFVCLRNCSKGISLSQFLSLDLDCMQISFGPIKQRPSLLIENSIFICHNVCSSVLERLKSW